MNAPLRTPHAERFAIVRAKYFKPYKATGLQQRLDDSRENSTERMTVIRTVVEEMGVSDAMTRTPESCPVIRATVEILTRLGLMRDEWSLVEIATLLGISKERVRQHECRGRARMLDGLKKQEHQIIEDLQTLDELRRGWILPEGME